MNQACYQQMRQEIKKNLLSSYFHRIFSNVDNMFIFKKQFTKYHAVNSFFAYVFNQANSLDLGSLSFCKATGKINFTKASLAAVFQNKLPANKDYFYQGELAQFTRESKGELHNSMALPVFELSPSTVQMFEETEAELFRLE